MNPSDPRDRDLEQLLRRHLPSQAEPSDDCLEPETLAAWADGELTGAALAEAEAHTSACARCQALMSAMVRSEPQPETSPGWWPAAAVRWLVPLAGAAAAALVWMVAPSPQPAQPELTEARLEAPAPASADEAAPPLRDQAAAAPPVAEQKASPMVLPEAPAPAAAAAAPPAAAPVPAEPAPPSKLADTVEANRAAEAAATDALRQRAAKAEERDTFAARRAEAELLEVPRPPAAPRTAPPAPADRPAATPDPATLGAASRAIGGVRASAADRRDRAIASSDGKVGWRLIGGGLVERSTDNGASWTRMDTGVVTALNAGAAPSADICWLVGDDGVVLLTTDGRTFQRRSFPTRADLVSVTATDARTARVVTGSGEAFRTTDGGATWMPEP